MESSASPPQPPGENAQGVAIAAILLSTAGIGLAFLAGWTYLAYRHFMATHDLEVPQAYAETIGYSYKIWTCVALNAMLNIVAVVVFANSEQAAKHRHQLAFAVLVIASLASIWIAITSLAPLAT